MFWWTGLSFTVEGVSLVVEGLQLLESVSLVEEETR